MKAAKWRELSDDEVAQKARELSEEVFNLRFQLSMGVAKNPARVGLARRDLARAFTILKERGAPAPVTAAPAAPPATAALAPAKRAAAKAPAAKAPARKAATKKRTTTAKKTAKKG